MILNKAATMANCNTFDSCAQVVKFKPRIDQICHIATISTSWKKVLCC